MGAFDMGSVIDPMKPDVNSCPNLMTMTIKRDLFLPTEPLFTGARRDGERCGGKCNHSSSYHTVKFKAGSSGLYYMGCAKVDCSCMAFVSTGIPNEDAR